MKIFFVALVAFLGFFLSRGPMDKLHGKDGLQPKAEKQRVKKLFDAMRNGKNAEEEFPRFDLTDVPALLEFADSTKMLKSFPRNPISSQFEFQCSEGMVALWLIEGVRQGSKYPSLNALCFKDGVQAKDWTAESEANHKDVAKAYRAWWKKTRSLTPEKANEINPLTGTNLHWH